MSHDAEPLYAHTKTEGGGAHVEDSDREITRLRGEVAALKARLARFERLAADGDRGTVSHTETHGPKEGASENEPETFEDGSPYLPPHYVSMPLSSRPKGATDPNGIRSSNGGGPKRRKLEEALRQSRQLLATILRTVPEGIVALQSVRDREGAVMDFRFVAVNPAAERVVRASMSNQSARRLLEVLPGVRDSGLFDRLVAVVDTGTPFSRTLCYTWDGLHRWFDLHAVKLNDGLVLTLRDVTEREEAEEVQLALAAAHVGTWEVDLDTMEVSRSRSMDELFGLRADGSRRFFEDYLKAVHDADRTGLEQSMREAAARGGEHNSEFRIQAPGGGVRWVVSRGTVARDGSGRFRRLLGAITDITDRKKVEDALRAAVEAAETANRTKGVFLANMSHEIRTPLTGMIGFASLLARQTEGKQRMYAERIEQGGKRLTETLNALLTLARLEAGHVDMEPEQILIADETLSIVQLYRPEAEHKGLHLGVKVKRGARSAVSRLDRGALNSVLQNLIANAIKFTEVGRVLVTVEVYRADSEGLPGAGRHGRWVRVHVEDTGIGISAEFMPHLFQAFRQESSGLARSYEGSGLGLSITRQLVEKMGGRIFVQSEKGRGSRFTVTFPASEPVDDVEDGEGEEDTYPVAGRRRLLVVEDNEDARALIGEMLSEVGEVACATSVGEAVSRARLELVRAGRPFDAVFLDINLGHGANGGEVLAELRTIPAYASVPVIALTAYALTGDRERFLAQGFTAYLSKPFVADDLLGLAAELLRS